MTKCSSVLLSVVLLALLAPPAAAETASGPVTLKESKFGPPKDAPKITLGAKVKATGSIYITEFFGTRKVSANTTLKNTADKPMFYAYHVAVFDKAGKLLGSASQGAFGDEGLKAGEETQLGSLLITLPEDALKQVATYQVTLYESDKKF